MQKLREVQRALSGEEQAVTCVLISVDGDRDTPQAMKAFLEPFGAGFVGLTGKPTEVRKIANTFAAVFFKGMPSDRSGGYNVEHTSQVYLVDGEGRLRATFYDAPAERMVATTRRIAREPVAGAGAAQP
jgi:protein SCO1/2